MAINPDKLVSAAMLQDFIIGKDAEPLAAGVITMYKDNDHFTLKNWYYQTGDTPPYLYATLPNPMVLSAAGTMQDVNGNDIIPFYYPWNEDDETVREPYFVTVYNSNAELQFTRSNFPFVPGGGEGPTVSQFGADNLIINNRFWRNANIVNAGTLPATNVWTTQYNSTGTVHYVTLAPDQHDGFSMPDFNYFKTINGNATETIKFLTFPKQTEPLLVEDIQPEFYVNFNCTSDISSSTIKAFQFPISLHLATLADQDFTFTIQAKAETGSAVISIYLYAFCGTGVASPVAELLGSPLTLTNTWTKYTLGDLAFQSTLGLVLGSDGTGGNDDAYYLQIRMPVQGSAVCNIDFAIPSIYLADDGDIPTNNFQTYDQIDSVIASARTGDVKTSLNDFYPFGWVPLSGGTVSHPNIVAPATPVTVVAPTGLNIAYQGYDAWALYNMVWTKFNAIQVNGAPLIGIYDAAGAGSTFGASAYADWNALKQLTFTDTMGQVIMGTVPPSAMTSFYQQAFTASNLGGKLLLTFATPTFDFPGMPFMASNTGGALPTGLVANTVYWVASTTAFSSTTFGISTSFANAMAGTTINFTDVGSGTNTASFINDGLFGGEYGHLQLQGEVGPHTHPIALSDNDGNTVVPRTSANNTTVIGATQPNTFSGRQLPINVTQPYALYNMFIKL